MTRQRALRLAREWAQGHVCSIRDGEAAEYHSMFAAMLEESMSNEPLTLEQLREMEDAVWCVCKTVEGFEGFWCLCNHGYILTPARQIFDVKEIPHWVFYRRPPEGGSNETK